MGAGYALLGISPDEPDKLVEFREREALTFPSSPIPAVASTPPTGPGEEAVAQELSGPIRSTFVIDEDGRVDMAMYNVQAIGHVKELRRILDDA